MRGNPIQKLRRRIDLIGEIAVREFDEFSDEFIAPRRIFWQ
jgi:hypothetical protein